MSQYPQPSPYTPPSAQTYGAGYASYEDHLAPARRAGILMFLLGILLLGCGGCFALAPGLIASEEFRTQQPEFERELERMGVTTEQLRIGMYALAGVTGFVGISFVGLAFFVRKGYLAAIIIALVFSGMCALVLLINILSGIPALRSGADPVSFLMGACMIALPMVALVLLCIWLIQAIKGSSRQKQAMADYQRQWYEYQRNYQAYQQQMGYGATPPPPQQTPPPPPPGNS